MAAKVESTSAYKGIGLVKLMGRQSGFITMQASMASGVQATWVQLLHPPQTLCGHEELLRPSPFCCCDPDRSSHTQLWGVTDQSGS